MTAAALNLSRKTFPTPNLVDSILNFCSFHNENEIMFLLTSMIYIRSPHVILHKMCGKIMLAFTSLALFIPSAFNGRRIEKIKFLRVCERVGLWRVALKYTLMFPSEIACNFPRLPSAFFVRTTSSVVEKLQTWFHLNFIYFERVFFCPSSLIIWLDTFCFMRAKGTEPWSTFLLLSFKWVWVIKKVMKFNWKRMWN